MYTKKMKSLTLCFFSRCITEFPLDKLARFLVTGGFVAAINIAILYLLREHFQFSYLVAINSAFLVAVTVNFLTQKFFTFQNYTKEKIHIQAIFFYCASGVYIVFNNILMYSLISLGVWYVYAQVMTIAILAVMNFLFYKKILFCHDKK